MISLRLTRCFHIRFFKSRSSSAGISSEEVCATWKSCAKPHNRCNVVPEDTSVSTRGENGVDGRKGEIVRERGSRNDYLVRRRGLSLGRNERSDHPSCLVNSAMTTGEVQHQNMQVGQCLNTPIRGSDRDHATISASVANLNLRDRRTLVYIFLNF